MPIGGPVKNVISKLVAEFRKLIPVTIYFLVANDLLALTYSVILDEVHINATAYVTAVLFALVVAKVVLVADMLPFMNIFSR